MSLHAAEKRTVGLAPDILRARMWLISMMTASCTAPSMAAKNKTLEWGDRQCATSLNPMAAESIRGCACSRVGCGLLMKQFIMPLRYEHPCCVPGHRLDAVLDPGHAFSARPAWFRWRFVLARAAEQNAPLGRAVIGGLIFATVATLMFVPVVFSIAHKKRPAKTVDAMSHVH
jgi:hypothetical protein